MRWIVTMWAAIGQSQCTGANVNCALGRGAELVELVAADGENGGAWHGRGVSEAIKAALGRKQTAAENHQHDVCPAVAATHGAAGGGVECLGFEIFFFMPQQ